MSSASDDKTPCFSTVRTVVLSQCSTAAGNHPRFLTDRRKALGFEEAEAERLHVDASLPVLADAYVNAVVLPVAGEADNDERGVHVFGSQQLDRLLNLAHLAGPKKSCSSCSMKLH